MANLFWKLAASTIDRWLRKARHGEFQHENSYTRDRQPFIERLSFSDLFLLNALLKRNTFRDSRFESTEEF